MTFSALSLLAALACSKSDDTGMVDTNPFCFDEDMDGVSTCDGDCDDADEYTYPGAAQYDSSSACMRDADADGWGDMDVPAHITAGSDCADDLTRAWPGAAELESPTDCMRDQDQDGYGSTDTTGYPHMKSGLDCDDTLPRINPDGIDPATDSSACAPPLLSKSQKEDRNQEGAWMTLMRPFFKNYRPRRGRYLGFHTQRNRL